MSQKSPFTQSANSDSHVLKPDSPQYLRYPTSIVLVSLIAHGGERGLHVPGFEYDRLEPTCPKAIGQPLGWRAGLKPHTRNFLRSHGGKRQYPRPPRADSSPAPPRLLHRQCREQPCGTGSFPNLRSKPDCECFGSKIDIEHVF